MVVDTSVIRQLRMVLGDDDARFILRCAREQDTIERQWKKKLESQFKKITQKVVERGEQGESFPKDFDFLEFYLEHAIEVASQSVRHTQREYERGPRVRMAGKKVPRSLRDLMKVWDRYRKTGTVPNRIKIVADKVKKRYLEKVQSAYKKYSEDLRSGSSFDRASAVKKIEKAAETAYSRAKMIVETETTYHYNKVRQEFYDEVEDVSHYLYMAIRDHRTSKWCTPKKTPEGRGRHGLVYTKGTPISAKELPPTHWNCRSSIIPLLPTNPKHRRLIDDPGLRREYNICTPLPPGWGAR